MAPVMVSASTGAMNSVLFKLKKLREGEYKMAKAMKGEMILLADELTSMLGVLEKQSDMEDLDPSAKRWASQVREMTYDLEDTVDPFMHSIAQGDPNPNKLSLVKKASLRVKSLRRRSKFYEQVRELRDRFEEASDRRSRYKIDSIDYAATSRRLAVVSVDPRSLLRPLHLHGVSNHKDSSLVGIDGRGDKLIQLLLLPDDQQRLELKVVAIVGMGGSGKTTLAINVYQRLQDKFEYRAFVSVSRNPDITKILQQILRQVGAADEPDESIIETTGQLADRLRNFLSCKRYACTTIP